MATLQGISLQDLPVLVQDSHLEATFHPSAAIPTETTHMTYWRRRGPQQERWVRQKMLGRGGFGIVWLEEREPKSHTSYNSRAVKQLDLEKLRSKKSDYVKELEALAKFSQAKYSEFFIKSYGWFQSPSALFLTMEYCELGDLKDHVEMYGKLPEDQVQDIGCQVLQGLRFMHQNNFAHRDLKPANILIKDKPPHGDWYVKICDFGLSKRIGIDIATTTVKGTPGFMPPELIHGIGDDPERVDHFPADMWCFGETIFYLLTHKRAFGGDLILLKYWKGGPFPKAPLLHVSASAAAISFVQQLMASAPTKRLTAEMAAQHELMKTEPLQKVDQEIGETSNIKGDSSSSAVDEQASGRWTTLDSLQQSVQLPSGSRSTIIAPNQKPRDAGRIDISTAESWQSHRHKQMSNSLEADTQTQSMREEDSRRTLEPQLPNGTARLEHQYLGVNPPQTQRRVVSPPRTRPRAVSPPQLQRRAVSPPRTRLRAVYPPQLQRRVVSPPRTRLRAVYPPQGQRRVQGATEQAAHVAGKRQREAGNSHGLDIDERGHRRHETRSR
ncbi:uncharacterized protein NECHADRAFT_81826 [Fusarium vanettenii 77-13-4]|uniref:non-specific serine/threonine protein kinase n=1 Tax=Fusarium vanettenii (strain ATCC MYA-4622 / CBS 123669 / FGSC 9596 / NRRL 45880 / 77-13-4) TaxID=660122 RepID=C7Z9P6_FUSV7|nr:uncharacterized protein NECHADRAFT_81826 [Fusarium vanettenii 77-13-4]EEU39540.1 hypothetical protein NECHADRAFT_81826 [Fusarium vanettenii 77-13-4]